MPDTIVWTWVVRNEWGWGTQRTRWKLTEEGARMTFGDRLVERVEASREERAEGDSTIKPGYMSKKPGT